MVVLSYRSIDSLLRFLGEENRVFSHLVRVPPLACSVRLAGRWRVDLGWIRGVGEHGFHRLHRKA
jgi:hypothetical protein